MIFLSVPELQKLISLRGRVLKPPPELIKKFEENMAKRIPLRRIGQTLDVSKGITFLASTDAQFITGAILVIDGGEKYNSPANMFDGLSFI